MSYLRHRAARRRPHVPHLRHEANRPAAGAAEKHAEQSENFLQDPGRQLYHRHDILDHRPLESLSAITYLSMIPRIR